MTADQLLQFLRIPKQMNEGSRVSKNIPFTLNFPSRYFSYSASQTRGDSAEDTTIHVLVGPNNQRDWRPLARIEGPYLRTLRPGEARNHRIPMYRGRLESISAEADSFKALAWAWKAAHRGDLGEVEPMHVGECGRCGRELTKPESIERGIGPVCWEKLKSGAY